MSVCDANWSIRLTKNQGEEVVCLTDLPSMRNLFRSAPGQLVAVALVACMVAACPAAFAQTAAHALDQGPESGARQGGSAALGVRVDQACNRLVDGRGQKVYGGRGGEAGASITKACPADNAQPKPVEVNKQPKAVAPSLEPAPITAGSAQAPRDRGARATIAPRVSPERLSATLVGGGTAMFLLHSSLWTYLLILGLPLWQHVDLLPIVDRAADDDAATGDPAPDADAERAVTRVRDPRDSRGGSREEPG